MSLNISKVKGFLLSTLEQSGNSFCCSSRLSVDATFLKLWASAVPVTAQIAHLSSPSCSIDCSWICALTVSAPEMIFSKTVGGSLLTWVTMVKGTENTPRNGRTKGHAWL